MFKVLKTRLFQKYRTSKYPNTAPVLPKLYLGLPEHSASLCKEQCNHCETLCPVKAIKKLKDNNLCIDLGKCIFCGECQNICPTNAIKFTNEHKMTASSTSDLIVKSDTKYKHAHTLENKFLKIFKRSFRLRQVSSGGCNACEADTNVLGTVGYDLSRFGISFVASPRHADGLLITGPVTVNMKKAMIKTYEAVPNPKIVIVVGACAISGGLFSENKETNSGVEGILPVDYYIPGCPPNPYTILDGLLTVINKNL